MRGACPPRGEVHEKSLSRCGSTSGARRCWNETSACTSWPSNAGGVGRVGLLDDAGQVVIEPVNYRVLDRDVIIQVGPGSMLDAARRQAILAFETDGLDPSAGQAWSVLVRGLATEVEDQGRAALAQPTDARPLVPEPGTSFVRIRSGVLTGRRFPLRAPN